MEEFNSNNFIGGAIESPEDNRSVYVEEIAGAPEMPEEFFSPYAIAAYLRNGINNQHNRNSCVTESADKINEGLAFWILTPDSIPDGEVIDYLFEVENGNLKIKRDILFKTQDSSPAWGYYVAKQQIDGMPNQPGTYLTTAGKLLNEYGICEERLYSSHALNDEEVFKIKPTTESYENAKQYKILRYAQTEKNFSSYKLAIWTAHGNGIIGGYPLGGGSDLQVQPQKPPTTTPSNGHANEFFGWDKNYLYSLGSWGADFGLSLALKIVEHPKFGKIFVRTTKNDYAVLIKGCHQLGIDWDSWLYRGVMPYDEKFSSELEKRIKMLKVLMEQETGRVFVILKGKRYMLTDPVYKEGRGELWPDIDLDKLTQVPSKGIVTYPLGGSFGKIGLVDAFKILVGGV